MINSKILKTIEYIFTDLNNNNINSALVGTCNLAIQDLEVRPRDIDIVVEYHNLEQIQKIFEQYVTQGIEKLPFLTDKPAWDLKLNINNLEVQILGEENDGKYVSKLLSNRTIIKKHSKVEIKCFSLDAEADAYDETHRPQKARFIREYLSND